MEALNGFFLITWAASIAFLAVDRSWPWNNRYAQSLKGEISLDVPQSRR
jgi:hypothetical protein